MGILRLIRLALGRRQPRRTAPSRPYIVSSSTITIIQTIQRVPAATVLRGKCWVIDGDTIVIGQDNIRLAGIDAPELDHPYGKNAKWALIQLCQNQVIQARVLDEMSHNRLLAICTLPDGRDLAAEMVKQGMAIDWPKYSGGRYKQYETPDARRKLWRADARQKGRMPPPTI